jgi:hypothetical protein
VHHPQSLPVEPLCSHQRPEGQGGMYIYSLHSRSRLFFKKVNLKCIVQLQKGGGGQEWCQLIGLAFLYNCRWFLMLLSCVNLKKPVAAFWAQKRCSLFLCGARYRKLRGALSHALLLLGAIGRVGYLAGQYLNLIFNDAC